MNKKTMIRYALLGAVILIVSAFTPHLIHKGSQLLVRRILSQVSDETEEQESLGETENVNGKGNAFVESAPLAGQKQTDQDTGSTGTQTETGDGSTASTGTEDPDLSEVNDSLQEQKDENDRKRLAYEQSFTPEVTQSRSGLTDVFIGDREAQFVTAMADHLFSAYGDIYLVTRIDLIDLVGDSKQETTCQVKVFAEIGGKEYSEYYFCSYNKTYQFYSVYAYQE